MLFLGRHAGFPVALEGALKLKELAYIHAEGFAAGELKHGPIALIEEGLPVFCVVPPRGRDQLHDKMISAIQEVRARGARTIVLAEEDDESVAPVRRRADPAAPGLHAAAAAGGGRAAAAVRLRARDPAGPRRRPAAQPGQVRHGRVAAMAVVGVGIDVVDVARFGEALDAHAGAAGPAVHAGGGRPAAGLAGRPVRRQGGAGQGARGAERAGLARRRGGLLARGRAVVRAARHRRRAGRRSSAPSSVHVSLSHDAGIASAVVVLES